MEVRESEEMYLETILLLKERKGNIRSVDIVEELNYAKSSVSRAVNLLVDRGYITINRSSGDIGFTEAGYKRALGIYERHLVLTKALVKMGASLEEAEDNACRMEHVITDNMFEIIKKYVGE